MARSNSLVLATLGLIALLVPAAVASAGDPPLADLTGTWDVESQSFLEQAPEGNGVCDFVGNAQVVQQPAGDFSGNSTLNLVSGPAGCPATLSADLSGAVSGLNISMAMLMGGQLGTAFFSGQIAEDGRTVSGDHVVESGPFAGVGGTFNAVLGQSVLEIPTLTGIGLALLALLLLALGVRYLGRMRTA
jgi:hypothetical protein